MKQIFLLTLLSFTGLACAQSLQNEEAQPKGFHQHDGFFASLGIGGSPGNVYLSDAIENLTYAGTGFEADLKLGGAIAPNFILHATLINKQLNDKKPIGLQYVANSATRERTFSESIVGAGITYYLMPYNAYVSLSLGLGSFSVAEQATGKTTPSPRGPAFQLKLGKEWWVAKNWGIGLGITYEKINLQAPADNGNVISSEHIGVLFNATFN